MELPVRDGRARFGDLFDVPAPPGELSRSSFFRPEDVRISANGRGERVTVENKMFQGSTDPSLPGRRGQRTTGPLLRRPRDAGRRRRSNPARPYASTSNPTTCASSLRMTDPGPRVVLLSLDAVGHTVLWRCDVRQPCHARNRDGPRDARRYLEPRRCTDTGDRSRLARTRSCANGNHSCDPRCAIPHRRRAESRGLSGLVGNTSCRGKPYTVIREGLNPG